MFCDKLWKFCNAGSLILAIGNAILPADVVPVSALGLAALKGLGTARIVGRISTTVVGAGATIALELRASTLAALTGGTTVVLFNTGAIAIATLVANYKMIDIPVPDVPAGLGFVGWWETVVTANVTAGAIEINTVVDAPNYPVAT